MKKIIGIVAMTSQRVIGRNGKIPWHLSEDFKMFKRRTINNPIVMGRSTFDSLIKPLPERQNIVLTRNLKWKAEGIEVIHSPEALDSLSLISEKVFIIGGSEIYQLFLDKMDELYVSHLNEEYEGDTYFPKFKNRFLPPELQETYADFKVYLYKRKKD